MADTFFEAGSDIRELNPHDLIENFGGFEVFTPINSNDTQLEDQEIQSKQREIATAVEMITEWAAIDDFSQKVGFEDCKDLREVSNRLKQNIISFTNGNAAELSLFDGDTPLNINNVITVAGKEIDGGGVLNGKQRTALIDILVETFSSEGILSLGRDSTVIDRYLELAKTDSEIDIALKNAGAVVQKYVNIISSFQDKAKLEQFGQHVQEGVLSNKKDGTPRGAIAKFMFGDITAGKNTLTKKLNINQYTFITGTGGVSAPGPEYFHLDYISKGFRLFVRAQGFNSIMDNIALPSIAGFRLSIEDEDAPIVFDGYPRSTDQSDRIIKYLDKNRVDVVYMEVRNQQEAAWRSINRIFSDINNGVEVRSDDIDSLALYDNHQQDTEFRLQLIQTLQLFITARRHIKNGNVEQTDIDDLTNQIMAALQVKMANNSRYYSYRKSFPGVVNQLKERGFNVARIPTDEITRDNVAQAFLNSVNTDYLPHTELTQAKKASERVAQRQEAVIMHTAQKEQLKAERVNQKSNTKKLYDTNNISVGDTFHNFISKRMKETNNNFDYNNQEYAGLFMFRINGVNQFGTIVGVELDNNGRYQPIISVSGMNRPLRLHELPREFQIVNTTKEAAEYQKNLRAAYHGYKKMLAEI